MRNLFNELSVFLSSLSSNDKIYLWIFLSAILLFVFLLALSAFFLGKLFERISSKEKIRNERKDAVNRSRAVLGGQMTEQIAPFLPNFPCNPADVRFVGKPIDFVAFPGASENEEIDEVLFIEVKTGGSKLSEREKQIKAAVEGGRVRYQVYRAD